MAPFCVLYATYFVYGFGFGWIKSRGNTQAM